MLPAGPDEAELMFDGFAERDQRKRVWRHYVFHRTRTNFILVLTHPLDRPARGKPVYCDFRASHPFLSEFL